MNLGVYGAVPPAGVQGAEPLGGDQGAKPPEAKAFLMLKYLQVDRSPSTYFLVKDDRKANFNNFDAWKYPIFFSFSPFLKSLGGLLPPCPPPPHGAAPGY